MRGRFRSKIALFSVKEENGGKKGHSTLLPHIFPLDKQWPACCMLLILSSRRNEKLYSPISVNYQFLIKSSNQSAQYGLHASAVRSSIECRPELNVLQWTSDVDSVLHCTRICNRLHVGAHECFTLHERSTSRGGNSVRRGFCTGTTLLKKFIRKSWNPNRISDPTILRSVWFSSSCGGLFSERTQYTATAQRIRGRRHLDNSASEPKIWMLQWFASIVQSIGANKINFDF